MKIIGLQLVAFSLFLCVASRAKALTLPAACEMTVPAISVVAEHRLPGIRSSYSVGQIRALAARAGHDGRHPPFGFYAGTFGYSIDIQDQESRGGCGARLQILVRMFIDPQLVEIGSDGPCRPEAVTSHYLRHAQGDDRLLSHYAAKVTAMLDTLTRSGAGPESRQSTERWILEAMDELLRPYDADRKQALSAVDNDEELAQLHRACGQTI